MLLDVLTAMVLAFVAVRITQGTRAALGGRRQQVVRAWRQVRPRHVLAALPLLLTILPVAFAALQVPGLDVGWWTLIGGTGNPATGTTDRTTGTPLEWLLPLAFLVLLLPALPLFAEREERWFRLGAERRSFWQRRGKDLQFGLIHAVVGVPVGVALALAIGGAAFTHWYLRGWRATGTVRGALRESTSAHLAYNAVIVVFAIVTFAAFAATAG